MVFQPDSLYQWTQVTSTPTPITIASGKAYLCKGTSPLQFKLPTTCFMGFCFKIVGYSNTWQVLQNEGQFMKLGKLQTTIGTSGSISSTSPSDEIWVVCQSPNIEFNCFPANGNPEIT